MVYKRSSSNGHKRYTKWQDISDLGPISQNSPDD